MKIPSYINQTAYIAVTTLQNPQKEYDVMRGYKYSHTQTIKLLQAARVFFAAQQASLNRPKPPRKTPPSSQQHPEQTAAQASSSKP